jgi:hypothetical protein
VRYVCDECKGAVSIDVRVGKDYCFEEAIRYAEHDLEYLCGWDLDGNTVTCGGCQPEDEPAERPARIETDFVHWVEGSYRAVVRDNHLAVEISHDDREHWMVMTSKKLDYATGDMVGDAYDLKLPNNQGLCVRAVLYGDRMPVLDLYR